MMLTMIMIIIINNKIKIIFDTRLNEVNNTYIANIVSLKSLISIFITLKSWFYNAIVKVQASPYSVIT